MLIAQIEASSAAIPPHVMNDSHPTSLDPAEWRGLREQGHRMLDDMFDYLEGIRDRPVWQPIPGSVRESFKERLPRTPTRLDEAHSKFMTHVLPYAVGNANPR